MTTRIALFGDNFGLPLALKHIPRGAVCALIGASIRPHQHEELSTLATSHGLPFFVQPRADSADYQGFIRDLRSCKPDVIMVVSYSMLLRPEILAVPKKASINVHGGLLPQYRGCNPVQWAIINNETEAGVTMHMMTPEIDCGGIIAQRIVPIAFEDTWVDVQHRISGATELLLDEQAPKVLAGKIVATPQDGSYARYHRHRHPEDGLIDWDKGVLEIYNLIRALVAPHPGAFYIKGPARITIDRYWSIPQVMGKKFELRKHLFNCFGTTLRPITEPGNDPELALLPYPYPRELEEHRALAIRGSRLSVRGHSNRALLFICGNGDDKHGRLIGLDNIDYRFHEASLTVYETHPEMQLGYPAAVSALCVLATRELGLCHFKLGSVQRLSLQKLSIATAEAGYRCFVNPDDECVSIEVLE